MLLFNKILLYTGYVLISFYLVITIINKQFGAIPQALVVTIVFTVIMLYWRSTLLIGIEDEKEQEEVKKKGENESEEKDTIL